jgi:predicted ArsR family transcriptional regulator
MQKYICKNIFGDYNHPMPVTTSRQKLLAHLKKVNAATPAEIARALGTTSANVRHHLSVMTSNGLVEIVGRRGSGRGRPVMVYGLSRLAAGDNLAALASALLDQSAPDPAERLISLAQSLSGDLADPKSIHITRRITLTVDHLNKMNYHARWEAGAAGPRIILDHCPYAAIIEKNPELCQMDQHLLEQRLAAGVEQTAKLERTQQGAPFCAFVVR